MGKSLSASLFAFTAGMSPVGRVDSRRIRNFSATNDQTRPEHGFHKAALEAEFQKLVQTAQSKPAAQTEPLHSSETDVAHLSVVLPDGVKDDELVNDLKYHSNAMLQWK